MKVIRFDQYGGPETLVLERVAVPQIGPDDVTVKIHATAVNPAARSSRKQP